MKKAVLILSVLLFNAHAALADQCAAVTKEQAQRALRAVLEADRVQQFCEPCGDRNPVLMDVKQLGIRDTEDGYWELSIDDQSMDLAYTYVNGLNLAKIVGCEATDVSVVLDR